MIDPQRFTEKFRVFTDCDGVLSDFLGRFEALHGKPFEHFNTTWCWEQITADPDYYFKLEKLPGADEYWQAIKPFNPTVLTGCPRPPGYDAAAGAKQRWVAKHLGANVPVITCMSKDKPLHMVNPGDILIDDHARNVNAWRKAGGTAILFVDHKQAINDFHNVVEALSELV
jgi:5'(3')-deoxyribonucleotidase